MVLDQPQPGLQPPPGVVSDFDAENPLFAPNIAIQTCVLFLITTLIVARCIIRKCLSGIWTLEDWLCLLSWGMFVCLIAMAIKFVSIGGGSHQWNVERSRMPDLLYWNNLCEVFYNVVILTTKITLLYMYLKLFAPRKKSGNWWAVIIVMVLNCIFYTINMFIKIFICVPRDAIWNKSITEKRCVVGLDVLLFTTAAWNTVSDIMILTLPAIFVSKLKLNRRKKLGIIAVFTVGAIAPIFSIGGIAFRVLHASSPDQIYWQCRILLFSEAEITAGIICTCLPAFQRLLKRKEKTFDSSGTPYGLKGRRDYVNLDRRRHGNGTGPRDPHAHYLDSEYLELTTTPGTELGNPIGPPSNVTTNVAGGRSKMKGAGNNQIWKTTEVRVDYERSNVQHDSDTASDEAVRGGSYLANPVIM